MPKIYWKDFKNDDDEKCIVIYRGTKNEPTLRLSFPTHPKFKGWTQDNLKV